MAVNRASPLRAFRERCESAFRFLCTEYGCRARGRLLDGWGFELYYWNDTTGVRLECSLRDPLLVWICRLPADGFPPRRDEYGARTRIRWYELRDIAAVITRREPMPSTDDLGPQQSAEEDAADLRSYGDQLLRGDFMILPQLDARLEAWQAKIRKPGANSGSSARTSKPSSGS